MKRMRIGFTPHQLRPAVRHAHRVFVSSPTGGEVDSRRSLTSTEGRARRTLPLPLWERIASPHEAEPNAWARLVRGASPPRPIPRMNGLFPRKSPHPASAHWQTRLPFAIRYRKRPRPEPDMTDVQKNGLTYSDAGVDIDAGNLMVEKIKPLVRSTRRPGADTEIGG